MASTIKILFVSHIESSFQNLFQTACCLRSTGRFEPVFMFDDSGYLSEMMHENARQCLEAKIPVVGKIELFNSVVPSQVAGLESIFKSRMMMPVRKKIAGFLKYNFIVQFIKTIRELSLISAVIRKNQVEIIVLGVDLAHYNSACYIKAAHRQGIPVAIVTDMMTEPSEFACVYRNNPRHSMKRLANRLVGKLFPKWVISADGVRIFRLPSAGMVLAKELLGLAPPLPWQTHSGYADLLLLESAAQKNLAVQHGLDERRIFATGMCSHDIMAEQMEFAEKNRLRLCEDLALDASKPLILLALPQDDQPVGLQLPFPSYNEMIAFIAKTIASCPAYSAIVCLHPSTSYDKVSFIETYGVKIVRRPTSELIPLCQIFVATISSTIKWAIACGKPVVAYDYNREGRSGFEDDKGVLVVQEPQELVDVFKRITTDEHFYRDIVTAQQERAHYWGRLDGLAGVRIAENIERLVSQYACNSLSDVDV